MANLKEFLINLYEDDPESFEVFELPYEMLFQNLPEIKFTSVDEVFSEDIDFENCEVLDINLDTNTIRFSAGGDWQTLTEFSVTLKDDGVFYYNDDAIFDVHYKDGLTTKDVLKMIGK